jgi:hypothetical protein
VSKVTNTGHSDHGLISLAAHGSCRSRAVARAAYGSAALTAAMVGGGAVVSSPADGTGITQSQSAARMAMSHGTSEVMAGV